jgi:iron complex outermembrane receptor protein
MPYKLNKIMLALLFGAASTLPLHVYAQENTQTTATTSQHQQINFSVAAGTLDQVLNHFAQQANISLAINGKLTSGKKSNGLQGQYSIMQGLEKLLINTKLTAKLQKSGSYVLVEKSANNSTHIGTLATAVVQSDDLKDGSAEDGYRSDEISAVGPWQGRTLQETPYSINVVSESLIQNLQATTPDKIYNINPVMQLILPQLANGVASVIMRGFDGVAAHNGISREQYNYGHDIVMEETAKIEVLTGLTGFFYGADSIGGTINYVSKKPTDKRLNNINFGNTSGNNFYLHGDFGGQFDEDRIFGYRLNVVTQDGDTHVDNQSIKRNSLGLVLDWQVSDAILIAVNASKRDNKLNGRQPYWWLDDIEYRPKAKDIDNKLWSQKWVKQEHNSRKWGASIIWNINENISWRSAYEIAETERNEYFSSNTLASNTIYNQEVRKSSPFTIVGSGGYSYLDINFNTYGIAHTLTTGLRFSKSHWQQPEEWKIGSIIYSGLSLTSPSYFPEPDWDNSDLGPVTEKYKLTSDNFIVGDDIRFNEQWSALVGISLVEVSISSYWDSDYKERAVTPNLSLIYQPVDNITAYGSYSEGFETGGIAEYQYESATNKGNVVNGGEALGPLTSSQIELGAKIDVNGMLFTAALFEIDKALEYYNAVNDKQYEFVQDGRQVHRGLEFTATGNLTDNLSLVGGFTLLDAQTKDNKENPAIVGKVPVSVSEKMFKLYGEYTVNSLSGLVVSAGFNHMGSFYDDEMNADPIDSYTLVDIGARYNLEVGNKEVVLRLNINNLTDEQYWVSGSYLGERRTVSASVSVAF